MSGIGEFAYTVLLGWMRAVFDWIWLMVSGRGGSGGWQWFLSNWKIWLVILLVGGLAVDWLMWVVRWRPYRLLWGRFHRATANGAQAGDDAWDDGTGYYEQETAADSEPAEWTDMTLRTLSEIDPNWSGDVVIDDTTGYAEPENGYYGDEAEEEETLGTHAGGGADAGYWAETPDEADPFDAYDEEPAQQPQRAAPAYADNGYYEDEGDYGEADAAAYAEQEPVYDDENLYAEEPAEDAPTVPQAEQTMQYGRPGLWPGAFPFAAQEDDGDDEPAPEDAQVSYEEPQYYTDEEPFDAPPVETAPARDTGGRRRRRRQGGEIVEGHFDNAAYDFDLPTPQRGARPAPPQDDRPVRLVQPSREAPPEQPRSGRRDIVRTVTGKPAKRRGFMRFSSSEDEPISGLPPLNLDDPFLPPALPDNNPDFMADDDDNL